MFTLAMTARPTCTTPKPFAFKTHTTHRVPHRPGTLLQARGVGKDAVGSWLDLAGFVAKSTAHTPFDELADKIGRDCYIDVAGWHLYLKDVKLGGQASMAQGIAQQLGAQVSFNSCTT